MTQQFISLGLAPNDGNGSSPRIAGAIINQNFSELYDGARFNVRARGAIGDGASHPAQTWLNANKAAGISTLAQLQAWNGGVYSFATALTNEMDWLGIQAAINAAAAANAVGGTVVVAGGTFLLDQELVAPDPTDGDVIRGYNKSLQIVGTGPTATTLKWPTDLGTGKYGLRSATVTETGPGTHFMRLSGLRLLGPGTPGAYGTRTVQMSGWRQGTRYTADNCHFSGFGNGVVVWGNHTALTNCVATDNYYNVYFDNNLSVGIQGDHYFANANLSGARFASLAVGWNSTCDSSTFVSCSVGFAPYGVYKEALPGGQSRTYLGCITNSTLLDFAIEAVGNAAVYCENADDQFENNFIAGGPGTDLIDTYYISARGRSSLYRFGSLVNNSFHVDLGWPGIFAKVSAGLIEVRGGCYGNQFSRAIYMLTMSAGKPIIKILGGATYDNRFTGAQLAGEFMTAAGTITANDILRYSPTPANGEVERMTSGAGSMLAGVAYAAASQGDVFPVVKQGLMTLAKAAGVAANPGPMESDPGGPTRVRQWTSGSGRPVVGVSQWYPDTASATVAVHIRVGAPVSSG